MELKHMSVVMELKELTEKGEFIGYGSTFGNKDFGGDICVKGCFERTLKEHSKNSTLPAMFFSHNSHEPIGDWLEMAEDSKGLKVRGKIWVDQGIEKAQQAYNMLKGTGIKGLSMGYSTIISTRDDKKGTRSLQDVDLFEVSPTPFPMNARALTTSIKSLKSDNRLGTKREFEQFLRDAGLSANEAKAFIAAGYAGLDRRDDDTIDDEEIKRLLTRNISILKGK